MLREIVECVAVGGFTSEEEEAALAEDEAEAEAALAEEDVAVTKLDEVAGAVMSSEGWR